MTDHDQQPADMLEALRVNLEAGLVKARRVVNAVNRGDARAIRDATQSLAVDYLKGLEREDLERVAFNALTMTIQRSDQLKTLQTAYRGVRGGAR